MNEEEKEIFASFLLNGNEFALSVSFVHEVIHSPSSFTPMPLAPKYLLGLFNLRGLIIPVVDLKVILKLNNGNDASEPKVAIIEYNGNYIGLLFDSTCEVFKSQVEERSDFHDQKEGSVIKGVFKKDQGKRLIQILNISELFGLQGIPKEDTSANAIRERLKNSRGKRRQGISFNVGDAQFAFEISEIREILKLHEVHHTALSIEDCIGAIDLRGLTVPIIDFGSLLRYRKPDRELKVTTGDRRVIVMKIGNELIGLMVDSIESIISFYNDELISFPLLTTARREMFIGCILQNEERNILLLNCQKILSSEEILQITHGHAKLYNTADAGEEFKKKENLLRQKFITFSIDQDYAINIGEVKEIIERSSDLVQAPNLPKHCSGLLNLRGTMIMIIDARQMYMNKKTEEGSENKVLIFEREGFHFGLIVDAVHAIVTFTDSDKMKLPNAVCKNKFSNSTELVEAVHVKSADDKTKIVLILDSKGIADKIQSLAA